MCSVVKTKTSIFPPGVTNANWFSLFNAVSFQITLGAPMILYAKSIGATATILGIIAALTPLLTVCQIPAAHYLERIGYKRFIFYGWGFRTLCIFAIAFVPFMSFLGNPAKIAFILVALFIFNLLRGISSGAWLPWLTALLPEPVRGRFLSRDQFFLHIGSLGAVLVCAMLLSEKSRPWQFAAVFFLSAVGGWVSLLCLKIIPDAEPGESRKKSNARVPWRGIVSYPPFFKLTLHALLVGISATTGGVFCIAFMKSSYVQYGESRILYIVTLYFLGAMLALPFVGHLVERVGSKAAMFFSVGIMCASFLVWFLMAGKIAAPSLLWIDLLYFVGGIAGGTFAVGQVRLMMNTMPEMGRSHFFAFFYVLTSLGTGLAPIVWGMAIDAMDHFSAAAGPAQWNKYSIYFFTQFVILAATTLYTSTLHEKTARAPATRADA